MRTCVCGFTYVAMTAATPLCVCVCACVDLLSCVVFLFRFWTSASQQPAREGSQLPRDRNWTKVL